CCRRLTVNLIRALKNDRRAWHHVSIRVRGGTADVARSHRRRGQCALRRRRQSTLSRRRCNARLLRPYVRATGQEQYAIQTDGSRKRGSETHPITIPDFLRICIRATTGESIANTREPDGRAHLAVAGLQFIKTSPHLRRHSIPIGYKKCVITQVPEWTEVQDLRQSLPALHLRQQ